MSRSTLHLATLWPSRRSQTVIFRRHYTDSGFSVMSFVLTMTASVTARVAGALAFQDRRVLAAICTPCSRTTLHAGLTR
jgi:hypothetical protein